MSEKEDNTGIPVWLPRIFMAVTVIAFALVNGIEFHTFEPFHKMVVFLLLYLLLK